MATFVLLQVQPLEPQAPAQSGDHAAKTQTQEKPRPQSTVINNMDNRQTCEECSKKDPVAAQDPDKWVRRGFWINSILTLVTLVVAGATWQQASAAKKQADYIVASERAWIDSKIPEQPIPGFMDEIEKKLDGWGLGIGIALRNTGKTACRVLDSHLRIDVVDSIDPKARPVIPNLPPEPIYRIPNDKPAKIAPRGTVWLPKKRFNYGAVIPRRYFMEKDLYGLRVADRVLCMYGFVEYEDAFKKKRVARFCYAYILIRADFAMTSEKTGELLMPPGFELSGPEAYNEST